MFTLREDHDEGDYLCSPLPDREEFWQRGCPTTGLPVAPAWRPQSASETTGDPMVRARVAVVEADQRVAAQLAEQEGRERQAAGWHAEIQAADHSACHDSVERDAPERAAGGGA
jgi:hypothetical protein